MSFGLVFKDVEEQNDIGLAEETALMGMKC